MKKILKEPLLHFILLGVLIFAYYSWVNVEVQGEKEIFVSRGEQQHLFNVFARTWQRPPTEQEFDGVLQDHIRNEIAYREGVAMGINEGDTIIRRRMRQKLELLTDEIVAMSEPADAELRTYLEENPEPFRIDPQFDLRMIYISTEQRGSDSQADAMAMLEQLGSDTTADWTTLGDPWLLPAEYQAVSSFNLERQMGAQFTEALSTLEVGEWAGPVPSGYGLHLVFIDSYLPGRDPELDEVRNQVKTEVMNQRRLEATDQMYEALSEKYTIEIEPLNEEDEA